MRNKPQLGIQAITKHQTDSSLQTVFSKFKFVSFCFFKIGFLLLALIVLDLTL